MFPIRIPLGQRRPSACLLRRAGHIGFALWTSPKTVLVAPEPTPLKSWTFVAGTYDNKTARLYIDGACVAEKECNKPIPVTDAPLMIGTGTMSNRFLRGMIGEIRLYDGALDADHIQKLYTKDAKQLSPAHSARPVQNRTMLSFAPNANQTIHGANMLHVHSINSKHTRRPATQPGVQVRWLARKTDGGDRVLSRRTDRRPLVADRSRRALLHPRRSLFGDTWHVGQYETQPQSQIRQSGAMGCGDGPTAARKPLQRHRGLDGQRIVPRHGRSLPLPRPPACHVEFRKEAWCDEPSARPHRFRTGVHSGLPPRFSGVCEQQAKKLSAFGTTRI